MSPSRRIEVEIIGSPASLKAALGASEAGLTSFEKKAKRIGSSMVATGRTLTRNVTLPIVGAGIAAGKLAYDYDTAITHVQALTGASAKQTKEWSDQLLKIGPEIAQTPQQLADALYFVASSGADVNQVLPITVASAKDAAAGMGDAQTVAQLLTSAINAYGPAALSAAEASDILTASIKVGKAEPAELAQSIGRAIPLAESLGVTFAETAASVAELTNTGLDADEAVTGVRAILANLVKPAAQSKVALHNLGLTTDELRKSVKERGLNVTLQELAGRIGDNREQMGKIFPNLRAMTAFLALTGKNAGKVSEAVDKVTHSTGEANKAFKTASEGPQAKFNRELAQIESTAIRIGNDLLPAFLDVMQTVGHLADDFDHLSDTEKHAIEIGLGIAALAGPVLTVVGNLTKLVGLFGKLAGVSGSAGAAGALTEAEAAGAGASVALGPLGLAAAALAIGFAHVYHEAQNTGDAFGDVDDESRRFIRSTLRATGATSALSDEIRSGGKNVAGYRDLIARAGTTAGHTADKIQHRLDWSTGELSKTLRGAARTNIMQYTAQLRGVARDAEAASHDTEHFGAAARRQYAHVASLARTTAQLAAAMNSVPNQKYVSLVLSVTAHLQTEGLAPGMGPEANRVGPGGSYHPPTPGKTGEHKNRAAGGPIMAGRRYLVGERGPELITAGMAGTVTPNHRMTSAGAGGDVYEIVIVNGEELRGYMRRSSRAAVRAAAARNRQLERMGSDA